jgi:hypothetical protein
MLSVYRTQFDDNMYKRLCTQNFLVYPNNSLSQTFSTAFISQIRTCPLKNVLVWRSSATTATAARWWPFRTAAITESVRGGASYSRAAGQYRFVWFLDDCCEFVVFRSGAATDRGSVWTARISGRESVRATGCWGIVRSAAGGGRGPVRIPSVGRHESHSKCVWSSSLPVRGSFFGVFIRDGGPEVPEHSGHGAEHAFGDNKRDGFLQEQVSGRVEVGGLPGQ